MRSVHHPADDATARPAALRIRPDLLVIPQQYGRQRYWLVKDPVALTYFHLCEEEHAIWQMLDGRTSLAEIKRRFEEEFAPLQTTLEHLQAFLGRLHESGLLLAEAPGQGRQLWERHVRRRRRIWMESCANVLSIRFHGLDPERFLSWLYPYCRWLFAWWFLLGCLVLIVSAAILAAVQFHDLQAKLPDLREFFHARNLTWLAVALMLAKVLHELAHALTCKHFGGECHEIGVLLLVFTPCLYCNVSDAWLLPGKWQRMAVSAAGIGVEVLLAGIATFLWCFSMPGLLNTLCLNMIFVCSFSTLLLNGNPLLRYDGYYVLADWLEVPNLAQQSRALVTSGLARFFLGIEWPADRSLPGSRRALLAVYGVASAVYRWLIVIGILWLCYRLLKPHGLALLAQTLTVLVVAGMVVAPAWSLAAFLRNPANQRRIRRGRAAFAWGVLAAAAGAVFLVPWPFRVSAPAVLEPRDARCVYVVVPGRLVKSVAAGEVVAKDQELARLVNLDVRQQIVELTGQRDQQRLQLENLRLRRADDPSVAPQIPAAEEALADVEEQLRQRRRDEESLILRAPASGTVLPPPRQPGRPYAPGQLNTWQGSPLDERNLGSHQKTGTLFCLVGSPTPLEAFLVVDQADVNFVRKGQRVRLQLDEMPGRVLGGTIAELAKTDMKVAPRELAKGTDLLVRVDENGIPRPLATSYLARVVLDGPDENLLAGTRGRAKVLAEPQPLGHRLYRSLKRTFNLAL
jgi:putative peptide zinc metalloprotease protein